MPELHHFDPGAGEKLLGILAEEEQRDVLGSVVAVHRNGDPEAPVKLAGIRLVHQLAAHLVQEFPHLGFADIEQAGVVGTPLVERNFGGHPQQLGLEIRISVGLDRFAAQANIEAPGPLLAAVGSLMRSHVAGRGPDHQDQPVFDHLRRKDRLVDRVDLVTAAPNPALRPLDLFRAQAPGRKNRPAAFLGDADDHVAAIEALEVVGERTKGADHLRAGGLLVPARLELDPARLEALKAQ